MARGHPFPKELADAPAVGLGELTVGGGEAQRRLRPPRLRPVVAVVEFREQLPVLDVIALVHQEALDAAGHPHADGDVFLRRDQVARARQHRSGDRLVPARRARIDDVDAERRGDPANRREADQDDHDPGGDQ